MTFDVRPNAYCWTCCAWIRDCDPTYWQGFIPYCSKECRGDDDADDLEETSDGPA